MDYTLEELKEDFEIQLTIWSYEEKYQEKMPQRAEIWEEPDPTEQQEFSEWQHDEIEKINDLFLQKVEKFEKEEKYFLGCSFKIYKLNYRNRLKDFLTKFEDATEVDFIKEELEKGILSLPYPVRYMTEKLVKRMNFSLQKRFDFLNRRAFEIGYLIKYFEPSIDDVDGDSPEYYEIRPLSLSERRPATDFTHPSKVKNTLTQSEILELIKALKLTGKIEGNNKDIVNAFSQFFSTQIKNPDQIIFGFKGRKNGGETLFLDELRTALFDYTKQ